MNLQEEFQLQLSFFERHLTDVFKGSEDFFSTGHLRLKEAIEYSLLSGGKRFRPLLSLLTAELLERPFEEVIPVAVSAEMIHCYSLIHDDLPSMDNDQMRRGKPTNHVVFGEALALLAGDALLTEAFGVIAKGYKSKPTIAIECVSLLSQLAGAKGMVGGQVLDMEPQTQDLTIEQIRKIHELKTGGLIVYSCEAASVACGASVEERAALKVYAENLGLAFQLSDDIQDYDENKPEHTSFVKVVGIEQTIVTLKKVTEFALDAIEGFGSTSKNLRRLALYNCERCL